MLKTITLNQVFRKLLPLLTTSLSLGMFSQTICDTNPILLGGGVERIIDCGLGRINIDLSGGTSPFEFNISNRGTSEVFIEPNTSDTSLSFNLPSGDYDLNISDANGCALDQVIRVPSPFLRFSLASGKNCISDGTTSELTFQVINASTILQSTVRLSRINTDGSSTLLNQVQIVSGQPAQSGNFIESNVIYEFSYRNATGSCTYTTRFIYDACDEEVLSVDSVSLKNESENALVFPNPTNGVINFNGIPEDLVSITIYNISGAVVLESNIQNKKTLDINHLGSGHYFTRIKTKNKVITTKIIKL